MQAKIQGWVFLDLTTPPRACPRDPSSPSGSMDEQADLAALLHDASGWGAEALLTGLQAVPWPCPQPIPQPCPQAAPSPVPRPPAAQAEPPRASSPAATCARRHLTASCCDLRMQKPNHLEGTSFLQLHSLKLGAALFK